MSLQTDFTVKPYGDDYRANSNYYRVLFKPGVAVQARELTQLQTILQAQIERFGDNIYKRGTIIEGCSLNYHSSLPYVKIKDSETDDTPVNIESYKNLHVRNSSNVTAFVVTTESGFESRNPDLNTLYVKYNSSGSDSNTNVFSHSDTLTVYDPNFKLFRARVIDGSSGFSNADSIEVVSSLAVQNSTGGASFEVGSFNVNDVIQNGVANAIIVEANTTANSEALVLKIRPLSSDLKTANNVKWRFNTGEKINNANTGNSASIVSLIGSGAAGTITTNNLGNINNVNIVRGGSGYYYSPYITASITSNSSISASDIDQLDITPQNFLTNITVANNSLNPIGVGYGVTVDEGVIYQKGFFSRVDKQLVIVNKYSNTGFTRSAGFFTEEDIVNSNEDPSLLDNATGFSNYTAPGSDRLRLTPTLTVLDKIEADANSDFLPIIEFSDGNPYKQNSRTVYNVIGDELARRTHEESGDYVLDQFILTTGESTDFEDNSTSFNINIDPGTAYIKGYRVETTSNYSAPVDKGIDTVSIEDSTIRIGYGSFIEVDELGGVFQFNTGDRIALYSAPRNYVSTSPGSNITPQGSIIGYARIRSLISDSGEIGTPGGSYRLYLFDIEMNSGQNFNRVRSVYYDGINKGVADIKLEGGNAILYDATNSGLVYKPVNALKSANSISYTYRTINQSLTANNTGHITLTPGSNEFFPYTGNLNTVEQREVLVIPNSNFQSRSNTPGTITSTSGNSNIVAGAGANFIASFKAGDHIKVSNSTSSFVAGVSQVVNSSLLTLTSNAPSSITGNAVLYFPRNVPISLNLREERVANVNSNGQLSIYLGTSIANSSGSSASANVSVVYNITANNINPVVKTSNRDILTRVVLANNAGQTLGPWALGVSDVFRLKSVHVIDSTIDFFRFDATSITDNFIEVIGGNNVFSNGDIIRYSARSSSNNIVSVTGLEDDGNYYCVSANNSGFKLSLTENGPIINLGSVDTGADHLISGRPIMFTKDHPNARNETNNFYIDNNQKEDYLDTSYLYLKPRTKEYSSNDTFLIEYDVFTSGAGVKTISSYSINDSANSETLFNSSDINTLELPEMIGTSGAYYDIRDLIDFRPVSSNTIPLTSNPEDSSIINPTEPLGADRFSSNEQKFPVPNSSLTTNIEYYTARNDRVVLNSLGQFVVVKGVPDLLDAYPSEPKDSLTLQYLRIPPYPSLPLALSKDTINILDTKIANEQTGRRKDNFRISTPIDRDQRARIQTKNYRMSDIATLERRLKDLEYYVSFNLAESIAKSRFIPSNSNRAIDRYKFGFFVDPFTDYTFADTDNPEFWSLIDNDTLVPKSSELNFEFFLDTLEDGIFDPEDNNIITLPYVEYELVAQNDATDVPIIENIPLPEPINENIPLPAQVTLPEIFNVDVRTTVTTNTVTQSTTTALEIQKNRSRRDSPPYVFDDFFYTLSTLSGPVEYFINHRDNNMATEFFQSQSPNGPWRSVISSASATAIRSVDITTRSLRLNGNRRIEHPGSLLRKSYGPVGGFLEDQHKITFQHNPENGQYYRVRVYKGERRGGQGRSGTFGYKLYYPIDNIRSSTSVVTTPTNFNYVGVVNSINPPHFSMSMSTANINQFGYIPHGSYVAGSQKFVISVTGLKPNTFHRFSIGDNQDVTDQCTQIRTTTTNTEGLLTDANGAMVFEYMYESGLNNTFSDIQRRYGLLSSTASSKIFNIISVDNASFATGDISLKGYTKITEELSSSYGRVNAPVANTINNSYDYTSNISSINDFTSSLSPSLTDNVITRNWSGGRAFNQYLNVNLL